MATKFDLDSLNSSIKQETKLVVAEAVAPVKVDVSDLKTRVLALETRPARIKSEWY